MPCLRLSLTYQELLLEELELEEAWRILEELAVRVLDGFLGPSCVVGRVHCLYRYYYWVVVIFDVGEIFSTIETSVDDGHLGWELLLQAS